MLDHPFYGTAPCPGYVHVDSMPLMELCQSISKRPLVLRASHTLQNRFETLLAKRRAGILSPEETREYEAICHLDTALSWLNRLARGTRTG
jgi:hypothetical protein